MNSVKVTKMSPVRQFLYSLGGRTMADVYADEHGEFVLMWHGEYHEYVKRYITGNNEKGFWLGPTPEEM